MNNEKNKKENERGDNSQPTETNDEQQTKHLHNPLTGKDMEITQEDLENEQKLKEAQTERD